MASAQTQTEPTRILMVYGHNPRAPGVVAFNDQLHAAVGRGVAGGVEFYEEFLDIDRFEESSRAPQLVRYFSEKYEGFDLDAIVTVGSTALNFTIHRLRSLFPRVPIVYGLAFEAVVDFSALPADVTGIRQPLPFASTFAIARALHPDADRVIVVAGSAARDSLVARTAVRQIEPMLRGLPLIVFQNWTYASLLDSLRHMPSRTIVIFSSAIRDQLGYEFNTGDIVPSLARVASVPLYGIARNWIGDGMTGGSVMDFGYDGKRTGELLVRVLGRAPGQPMPPPEVAFTPWLVDWRQLQRWRLSEKRLPSNTEILFRPPTPWERHWPVILAVLALVVAESALISRLLLERRRRLLAQRAVEEQTQYEQLLANLTADAVRVAPERTPQPLADALARIGRYAGANEAVLVVNHTLHRRAARWYWSDAGADSAITLAAPSGPRLEIPLVADNTHFGGLELYRTNGRPWGSEVAGRLVAAAGVIASALAREQAVRALEQSRSQIAHMGRVATMGELAAAVSHELRQPLTAIRSNAEAGARLIMMDPPDLNETLSIFQDIITNNQRAAEVIDHIGMLVRKQEPVTTDVDLNAVCQHTAHLLELDVRLRGARLKLTLDPQLPRVIGDPVQLQQVVINLAINALDATASLPRDHEIVLGTAASNGVVEVFVRDGGPGLSPDLLQQIFEPFYSTKPQGLGMGLAIVRAIVERHEGSVGAENIEGGGASFRVRLPIRQPEISRAFQTAVPATPLSALQV